MEDLVEQRAALALGRCARLERRADDGRPGARGFDAGPLEQVFRLGQLVAQALDAAAHLREARVVLAPVAHREARHVAVDRGAHEGLGAGGEGRVGEQRAQLGQQAGAQFAEFAVERRTRPGALLVGEVALGALQLAAQHLAVRRQLVALLGEPVDGRAQRVAFGEQRQQARPRVVAQPGQQFGAGLPAELREGLVDGRRDEVLDLGVAQHRDPPLPLPLERLDGLLAGGLAQAVQQVAGEFAAHGRPMVREGGPGGQPASGRSPGAEDEVFQRGRPGVDDVRMSFLDRLRRPSGAAGRAASAPPGPDDLLALVDDTVDPRLVMHHGPRAFHAEQYRGFRTNLRAMNPNDEPRTLLFTSASSGVGKSVSAANIALTLAESPSLRVCLVDADLRKGGQEELFGVPRSPGLTDLMLDRLAPAGVLHPGPVANLSVLPAGRAVDKPGEVLGSDHMQELVGWLKRRHTYVIFDTPPCLSFADAAELARFIDGVVLVVAIAETDKGDARRALELLRKAGANVVGTFVTGVLPDESAIGGEALSGGGGVRDG